MSAVTIREIGGAEIDAAMAVMARAFDPAFGEAWTRSQCLGILDQPNVWLLLAEAAPGRPIGFALSRITLDDAELLLLAVDPAARGRGTGRALIDRSAGIAAARGAVRLLLEVRANNPALHLYGQAGFGEIGRRRDYYRGAGGTTHDALTLACALSPAPLSLYAKPMIAPDPAR